MRDYFFQSAPGEWFLYQCASCDSGFLNPRPTQHTIELAYSSYFTHKSFDVHNTRVRHFWRALKDDYLFSEFGAISDSTLWPGRWLLRLFPITRQGIDALVARNLGRLPYSEAKLLDVGCGNGNFLEFARRAGWQVRGLDFDPAAVAVARARGLDVEEGTLSLLDRESECYDCITLSHVIEHVYDPLQLLESCHRLLKPGGVLWLETPNINAIGHTFFGAYWRGLEPPRHLQLFSRKCLINKMLTLGFFDISDRYSSFSTAAMWRESRQIMGLAGFTKELRHTKFGQLFAEIKALFSPNSREFITLMCKK